MRHDPKHVLETLVGFVDNAFNEVDYIKYPEDELYRKIKRDIDTEEDVLNFLIEIHKNFDEFRNRLLSAPQNQDASKPSETTLKTLINTISKIQDYMLTQGEAHNQTIYAMRYSKMLDLFKYPLLFAWEQFKYGWHSDFWEEGDSMLEYDIFLFNIQEHLNNCIQVLNTESPFRYFERNGQITSDLIEILSDVSNRLSDGQFKIL